MDKLELKHIAPYLPYGLRGNLINPEYYKDVINGELFRIETGLTTKHRTPDPMVIVNDAEDCLFYFKPILRPLSDLTKEMTYAGDTFVPLIGLLEFKERNVFAKEESLRSCSVSIPVKVIDCKSTTYRDGHTEHQVRYTVETSNMGTLIYSFTYSEQFDRFALRDETRCIPLGVGHQKQLFEKLYEWHFDLNGLIESCLAVDINTINQ